MADVQSLRNGLGVVFVALVVTACSASEGETCGDTPECSTGLSCHQGLCRDPATFCRQSEAHKARCERDGLCKLMAEICAAGSEDDCQGSRRCQEHGHCTFAGGCCSRDGLCRSEEEDALTHVYRLSEPARRVAAIDTLNG
ncbi:MAG: hypothetical protein DRI90_20145, partial [Deltaproteobacteria bacterium]